MIPPRRRNDLADEACLQIVEEKHGAQDGVAQRAAAGPRGLDQMLLDPVLSDEVRHVGGVVVAVRAVPVHGRVDEFPRARLHGGVHERGALRDFGFAGELDGEDAPGWERQGGEDGGRVVHVAGDELDGGGEGGEAGRGGGGGVARYGVDGVGGWGVRGVGEEGAENGAALLACCAGDEDGFRHCGRGRGWR